jgi:glycine cleavage system H protein
MDSHDYLRLSIDKFVFTVKKGYLYDAQGLWLAVEDGLVRVGVTDFLQESSGDVAFVNMPEPGTQIGRGEELGSIETIKADVKINSSVAGVIRERNEELDARPELVNEDPYGEGWLILIEPSDFDSDREKLLSAEEYLAVMKSQAEEEANKR